MNIVRRIRAFNAGRDPLQLRAKYRKMRASAFAFLRGSCHLFYDRLPQAGILGSAPLSWICGDLHVENFGSYHGDNGLVYFDMNDFDEAALAPASWEVVRLLASVWLAADGASIDAADARRLCTVLLDAYLGALAQGKALWVERDIAQGLVGALLEGLRKRRHVQFLDDYSQIKRKARRLRVDGKKLLAVTDAQRSAVAEAMAALAKAQAEPGFFEVLDVAQRIAGTGSLGLERYLVLVAGKGPPEANELVDLKPALPSSIAPHLTLAQPRWASEAQRVVTTQRRLQAVPVALLQPLRVGKQAFVLRALQASDDQIAFARAGTLDELSRVLATLGQIVAWAQLRGAGAAGSASADALIEFGRAKKSKGDLLRASADCARQAREDWATFSAAYDAGELEP